MDKSKLKPIIIDDSFTLGANNHSVNVSLAAQIGLTEAILIQNFYHWHCSNKENPEMIRDNRVWIFRSVSKIAEDYPYLSADKIRNALERLIVSDLLIKGNYNEDKFKKANWYSLSDLALFIMEGGKKYDAEITEPFGKIPNHSVNYQLNYNKENYNNNNKEERDKSLSKKDAKDELFEECWKAYQRRGSKAKSKTYWNKLTEEEKALVKVHIPAYVASVSEKKYIMYFERYLKDKFFNNVVYKGNAVLFDPEQMQNEGEYHPTLDGFNLRWIESEKCYMTPFDLDMLADGYTKENRPASAMVMKNGIRYIWDTEVKQWKVKR